MSCRDVRATHTDGRCPEDLVLGEEMVQRIVLSLPSCSWNVLALFTSSPFVGVSVTSESSGMQMLLPSAWLPLGITVIWQGLSSSGPSRVSEPPRTEVALALGQLLLAEKS